MCLMRHRPIKKVKRSSAVLLYGLAMFILISFAFYWGMWDNRNKLLPKLHYSLYMASKILILLLMPTYLLSVFIQPGTLERKFDFI